MRPQVPWPSTKYAVGTTSTQLSVKASATRSQRASAAAGTDPAWISTPTIAPSTTSASSRRQNPAGRLSAGATAGGGTTQGGAAKAAGDVTSP